MLAQLDEKLPRSVRYTRPDGGLFIWADLPEELDSDEIIKELVKRKLAVVPGDTFICDNGAHSNGFRMNYSTPSDEQIIKGVGILANVIKERSE